MPCVTERHHLSFRRGYVLNFEQRALHFFCQGSSLYGIVSIPEKIMARGLLIVVGGPQYRVGSHRQFTLLAKHLAAQGIPVMRFDYRGMGDSDGDARTFEDVNDDIRHALDEFFSEVPDMKGVAIWGLCDAASASLFYAHSDPRIHGLVLLNPWVRTTEGMAKAYLKHYYLTRLFERDLWEKIVRGNFNYRSAARSLWDIVRKALRGRWNVTTPEQAHEEREKGHIDSLPNRMLDGFERFKGNILLIMSGDDLTAKEFLDVVSGSNKWKNVLGSTRVQRCDLPEANHTFSRREWRDQVANRTKDWITSW